MGTYVSPHPEPLTHLPPQHIPLGCPRAPALSAASYIKLALVIYFTYGNIHVSMLFSQIIPPSLSPTESKVCSLNLCFVAFRYAFYFFSSLNIFFILLVLLVSYLFYFILLLLLFTLQYCIVF